MKLIQEEKDLQNNKDVKTSEVKEAETKVEAKVELPKGFYLSEVVTATERLIAFEGKQVLADNLLVDIANHLKEQTGFKLSE